MEDEEYLPENSDLRYYLESLNMYDSYPEGTVNQRVCDLPLPKVCMENTKSSVECIDKDIVEQIQELLSARMLFEEDVRNIERLLSNFKVVQIGMLRGIFENVSGFIVIVLGMCVYWAVGSYVFFMISIYYAYNAADYLWRKHFNQRRLRALTEVLQANYNLFRKTLKFIKDSDEILKLGTNNSAGIVTDSNDDYELYRNLKNEFVQAENEIIKILIKATKKLICKFPFYDYVENPKNYLCIKYEEFSACKDATKLYQIYLLVQSEFLQRLTLSLIPNIKIPGSNNHLELYKIIKETSVFLERLENKLNQKFKYIYLRGICDSENKVNFYTSKKSNSNSQNIYKNELLSNIQDMSNVFQCLLIQSRSMESNFSNGERPENIENQLADIQNELTLCQRNINDSIIVLKKFSNTITCQENENANVKEGAVETVQENCNFPCNLSDEENTVEDEIFEAYFASENKNDNNDDFGLEDFVKKKAEVEYSRLVLQELRTKIAEKAKEREVREAKIISKKMGEIKANGDNDKMLYDKSSSTCKNKIGKNYNIFESDENNSNKDFVSPSVRSEDIVYPTFQVQAYEFLGDIVKARERLLQSPVSEECFCNSENEDSD